LIFGIQSSFLSGINSTVWIEKYFRVKHAKLLEWEHTVEKYGSYFALLGWLPILGNVIMLALGFFKAPAVASGWWMFVGKTARYAVIIWLMN